ncbi:nonstructural protein 2 [Galliform chaphamaparvovirus 10]|nr:nonstructural protein 2 [Galliform chaphamaparvovirus 10]
MISGAFAPEKRTLCVIACISSSSTILLKIPIIILELVNMAANAVIAQQAAEARLLMASQALAECREQNNPYLPGNTGPFGPNIRQLMYAPDPCETQEKELAGATTDHAAAVALAQSSNAPTAQDIQSAPAPQLSSSFDVNNLDPAIPETEWISPSPSLVNMWSPTSLDQVLAEVAMELENIQPGSSSSSDISMELDTIRENITCFLSWDPWNRPVRKRKRYQYIPNNQGWIGFYVPR